MFLVLLFIFLKLRNCRMFDFWLCEGLGIGYLFSVLGIEFYIG